MAPLIAGVVCAVILATGPLGEGGRAADVLFAHQSLLAAAIAGVAVVRPAELRHRRLILWGVAAFTVHAVVFSSYRSAAMLGLADIICAAAVALLASLTRILLRAPASSMMSIALSGRWRSLM